MTFVRWSDDGVKAARNAITRTATWVNPLTTSPSGALETSALLDSFAPSLCWALVVSGLYNAGVAYIGRARSGQVVTQRHGSRCEDLVPPGAVRCSTATSSSPRSIA